MWNFRLSPNPLLAAVLALSVAPSVSADIAEDRSPKGGTGITKRVCMGGVNNGDLCNHNNQCTGGTCAVSNVIDLTVNLVPFSDGEGPVLDNDQIDLLRGYFIDANKLLYQATDEQFRLGTVTFVVANGAPNAAVQLEVGLCCGPNINPQCQGACVDVFGFSDCPDERPVCSSGGGGSAHVGGWGTIGGTVSLTIACVQSLCFPHELMHFIANVHDEYHGHSDLCLENIALSWWKHRCFGGKDDGEFCDPDIQCPGGGSCSKNTGLCVGGNNAGNACDRNASCPDQGMNEGLCRRLVCIDPGPPADPLDTVGCLMRGSGLNGGEELCWSANHDIPDFDTAQSHCRNDNSCWTQLGIEWPSVVEVPQNGPVDNQNDPPDPSFIVVDNVQGRFVTVIDRSGSMSFGDPPRVDVAIDATQAFIDLLDDGVDFGLASYSSEDASDEGPPDPPGVDSSKDFPPEAGLRELDSNADRTAAKDETAGLTDRTGGFTRIGAGLLTARDMLFENGGEITLNTGVVLMTDGINNRPKDDPQGDLDDALATLAGDDIPVFVTCIGSAQNSGQCAHIADQTGGLFVASDSTGDLLDAFVEFAAEVQGLEIAGAVTNRSIGEGELSSPILALVEQETEVAQFVLLWKKPATDLDLRLFRPDNSQVPEGNKTEISQGEFYRISNPEPGTWTMRAFFPADPMPDPDPGETDRFSTRAIVDHRRLNVEAGLVSCEITWPEGFQITASPRLGGGPVAGCVASVQVRQPDGTTETLPVLDDGRESDVIADDGQYRAEFRNFTAGDGDYTFTLSLSCREGQAFVFRETEESQLDESELDLPLPMDFDRVFRFSGSVSGVPDNLPPTAEICEGEFLTAECEGLETMVELDGTCSSDPENGLLTYDWSSAAAGFVDPTLPVVSGLFPLGFSEASLVVTDDDGQQSQPDTIAVLIEDSTAPAVDVELVPGELWPPNHRMVDVTAIVTVDEACDPAPTITLVSVTSDEPDDLPGGQDGKTVDDIQGATVGTPDFDFRLRAERDASGAGRTYTATYMVEDASGNVGVGSGTAFVPHDQGGKTDPMEISAEQSLAGTLIRWAPVADALRYHVLRGDLGAISEAANTIELGSVTCIEAGSSDETTMGYEDAVDPAPGEAFFYLVDYELNDGSRVSYGSESAGKPRMVGAGDCL